MNCRKSSRELVSRQLVFVESLNNIEEKASKPGSKLSPMSVSYLVHGTNSLLEKAIGNIYVEGEISSLKRAPSGHFYFTLGDDKSQMSCVLWKGDAQRTNTKLQDGDKVVANGRLGIYERDGRFQFYVRQLTKAGEGEEALALAKLKKKLNAEGLFDLKHKKELPPIPRRIGIVTSKTGAAVRDIIQTVQRRFPIPMLIADARVQGEQSAKELIRGLQLLQKTDVDVIIIGRGGGSAADLSSFNDEALVRAIHACPIPVVSAVGHEVDISLSDLVADKRAATPTMAGEIVSPVKEELKSQLRKIQSRLKRELELFIRNQRQELDATLERVHRLFSEHLYTLRQRLQNLLTSLEKRHPKTKILENRQKLVNLTHQLRKRFEQKFDTDKQLFKTLVAKLDSMSPLRVLDRGYALAVHNKSPLLKSSQVKEGDSIRLRLSKGELACTVNDVIKT